MGALYVNSSESKMNMEHTLLIVEDDCDTSEMLRVYFEAQGYRVITAASGGEALEKGRQQLPDLILQSNCRMIYAPAGCQSSLSRNVVNEMTASWASNLGP